MIILTVCTVWKFINARSMSVGVNLTYRLDFSLVIHADFWITLDWKDVFDGVSYD